MILDIAVTLNVLVLACLGAIALFGKKYLFKYVSEKAKNLATKEDISEITNQIESIKSSYAHSLEKVKSEYQVKSALQLAFQSKCFDALIEVNDLLVEVHLYCWKHIAERSPNEHYVWRNVDDSDENRHFHYYHVAIDKVTMIHSMYLTQNAKSALHKLADQIGILSSMELALSDDDPHPAVEDSAVSGYETGINAVEECREELTIELFITNES